MLCSLLLLSAASFCNSQQSCEFDALYCSLQSELLASANLAFLKVIFPDDGLSPRSMEVRTTMTIHYPVNATQCVGGDIEGIVSLGAGTGEQNSSLSATDDIAVTSTTWYWAHRWSNSLLLQLVLKGDLWRKVGLTHSLTTVLLIANTGRFEIGSTASNIPIIYQSLSFFMPCTPSENVTKLTWSYVLQWVSLFVCLFVCFVVLILNIFLVFKQLKAYALPLTYQELEPDGSYFGYVTFYSDGWQGIEGGEGTKYSVYVDGNITALYTLILIMQIILNITISAIAMKLVPTYIIKCCNKSSTAPFKLWDPLSAATSLYWSFVVSATIVFLSAQLLAIPEQVSAYHDRIYRGLLPLKLMVQFVYILALLAELAWAIYTSKDAKGLYIISGLKYLCCAICCFRKNELHIRMAVSLSMWIIMLFLLWGIDAMVSMIITAVVYPYAVFFTLCLFLSSWLFIVVFFAVVRHNTHLLFANHRSFAVAVQRVGIFVLATMLFGTVVIILWLLQYDSVQVRSITGFAVTAAPSVFLSLAAWFLKRKFLNDSAAEDAEKKSSSKEFSLEDPQVLQEIVTETL